MCKPLYAAKVDYCQGLLVGAPYPKVMWISPARHFVMPDQS